MKRILLSLAVVSLNVFAAGPTERISVTHGPFVVPVQNEQFNPLGPDFKSEGKAIVFLSGNSKLNFIFTDEDAAYTRTQLITATYTPDTDSPEYITSQFGERTGTRRPGIRIGFENVRREKLTWLFAHAGSWGDIRILNRATASKTKFSDLSDATVELLAQEVGARHGAIESGRVTRTPASVVYTAALIDEEEASAGRLTVTFTDNEITIAVTEEPAN